MKVIRIIGSAGGIPTPNDGQYLRDCDVDAMDGRGVVLVTADPDKAMLFVDAAEAMTYWRRRSKEVPTRPDGKPNRPLTAYTVEVIDAQEPIDRLH